MSRRLTWCAIHDCARVPRSDKQGTRCPRCFSEQQERYRRDVLGKKPFQPARTTEARRAAHQRYNAWRVVHRQWAKFAALPIDLQRQLVKEER